MIQKQSDDPDVERAAGLALQIIKEILAELPKAERFDYGGHLLKVGEYDVCVTCTNPIAEAQQAHLALTERADHEADETIQEHLRLAAQLFKLEAEAAIVRAEFHNGIGTEPILNALLGFLYDRTIHDDYQHSHGQGN